MSIRSWSTTAADNNAAVPNGWPEGMLPSSVNNTARQMMADVRETIEALPFFDYGHTPTRVDADTFTVATDLTALYAAGISVKLVGATTEYGVVTSSTYSAPDTTVNITGTVPSSLVTVSVGQRGAGTRHDRTAAEIAALVTPTDYSYQGGDSRRYSTFAQFCAVVAQGVEGHLWSDFSISAPVDMTGGVIIVHGNRTITATATINYMLSHSTLLVISAEGELLFDGDTKVTYNAIQSTGVLPKFRRVRVLDANGAWSASPTITTYTYGVTGDGILDECVAENCANVGFSARGNNTLASQTATLKLINCKTKGTTGSGNYDGSGVGYLFHISGMKVSKFDGGEFTGHANAVLTNGYLCSSLDVQGGYYYGVARGPTAGEETQDFVINGTVCRDISGNAVSADTTDGVGETIGVGVLSNNVAHSCGRAIRTTCSNINVIGNKAHECTGSGAAFVFAGDGTDVFVDGNSDYSSTLSRVSFYVTENTTTTFGDNKTNATARNCIQVDSGSLATFRNRSGNLRTLTASSDLSGSDGTIVIDATAGTVDLDLFDNTEVKATNFQVLVIKKDNVNNATITFQGGAAHGETINGATSLTLYSGQQYQAYLLTCIDGAAGTWIAQLVNLSFLQSGSTSWNPADLAPGSVNTTTVTVTGAAVGDFAVLTFSGDLLGTQISAEILSANTVTVTQTNNTGANRNVAAGNLWAMVWKKLG